MLDIDFALVEEKRPPMYTAMKYWGKKPHNIWGQYIENYTQDNGVVLDPFSGSAICAFEAVKHGKKAIAFDINPLTSFIIKVYSSDFNYDLFESSVKHIIEVVKNDSVYKYYYNACCPKCSCESAQLQNFKWNKETLYECGIECDECGQRSLSMPNSEQIDKSKEMENINLTYWYPTLEFQSSPSFSESFLKNIGLTFDKLWTKRNLYVLSLIFNEILKESNEDTKIQMLFGFIQSLHLCSKMCVPRRSSAKREFSTSWGRSAYIYSKRQMEMNPLLLFESNCLGKQSVKSALLNVKKHLGKVPKSKYISNPNELCLNDDYDIFYGIVDIKTIKNYIKEKSISFIITDPPYGGLVQYGDLSCIWLVWLMHYDKMYSPNLKEEITIKKGQKSIEEYSKDFTKALKNLHAVLDDNGKIVFTFHNQDLIIWNAFLTSISEAGFEIEKVIHQQNKRTGESNVSNPYGTSASDFYIRCIKSEKKSLKDIDYSRFETFVVETAIDIIKKRNEPTPYQILFNGLLSKISKAGYNIENFDNNISGILSQHNNKEFIIKKTNKKSGNLWWLNNYDAKSSNVIPLTRRVNKTIRELLKKKKQITIDDVLEVIFINYPNELTPDIRNVEVILEKYAVKSANKWVAK